MKLPPLGTLVLLSAFAANTLPGQSNNGLLRVLFLGNSLTDGNNVPALVQAMAEQQGIAVDCVGIAPGGYNLEDHWNAGHPALLTQRTYDVVVLQQGPSTLPESQANLREWAVRWGDEARRHGARPAVYMIWPVRTQTDGFALVSQSYRNAALAADAPVFPAGEVWQQVLQANPSIQLYTSDDLHATPAGSFLAAMVIGRGLYSLDPARVPTRVNTITIPNATLAAFRTAVSVLPAQTLSGLSTPAPTPTPAPDPANPPPPATAPPAPSPASGASSSGGGAPSLGFLLLLALAAFVRFVRPATRS